MAPQGRQEAARRDKGGPLSGMEAEALALKQRMAKPEMYTSDFYSAHDLYPGRVLNNSENTLSF